MQVRDPGHVYVLSNLDGGEQTVYFIKKEPIAEGETELKTVVNGTTNEEVLSMLIDRMSNLQAKMPCRENAIVLTKLEECLMWLEKRTAGRIARGVEGTHLK